jgi:hypothetical protein
MVRGLAAVKGSMSFDADPPNVRYRRLAQQCLDLLAGISHPETRVALLERAQTWTRLAEEYEARIARNAASEVQPAAQQQQQVQPKEPQGTISSTRAATFHSAGTLLKAVEDDALMGDSEIIDGLCRDIAG